MLNSSGEPEALTVLSLMNNNNKNNSNKKKWMRLFHVTFSFFFSFLFLFSSSSLSLSLSLSLILYIHPSIHLFIYLFSPFILRRLNSLLCYTALFCLASVSLESGYFGFSTTLLFTLRTRYIRFFAAVAEIYT